MPTSGKPRFLIGHGERLTENKPFISGPKPPKDPAYSTRDAIERLTPRLRATLAGIEALPKEAKPRGQAVALVTLHPEFLAKTQFPSSLFASVGLRAIGSRARMVTPEKWTPSRKPTTTVPETIELYMAGTTEDFERWVDVLAGNEVFRGIEELARVEDIRPLDALNSHGRIRIPEVKGDQVAMEALIHLPESDSRVVWATFISFAKSLGAEIAEELRADARGLVFVPIRIPRGNVATLAQFTFLRALRPVVKLRGLPGAAITRAMGAPFTPPIVSPFNPAIRVAVLDGGLPDNHGLPHVNQHVAPHTGLAHPAFLEHGTAVTGAFLWGALHDTPAAPYASVDHFRVLDAQDAHGDDLHAYRILRRVRTVMETGTHDIFNLSLGPDIAMDDDEIHPWTSTLDDLAADGTRLIIAAAGNNGEMPSPLCRIQVPGDGVNCLCVGATDRPDDEWRRAPYSAIGPGRRPGVTKPDLMAFGGSETYPFRVVRRRGTTHVLEGERGTSFAAPLVARSAAALRSIFSTGLHPLTLKCLLLHSANPAEHPVEEVGWGRVAPDDQLPLCPDHTARILYQGELPPKQLLRAYLPIPPDLAERITITATLCYATEISAADPLNYTNSGVEIVFRPNEDVHNVNKETGKESTYAKPGDFFKTGDYANEAEQRTRQRKWETVLHASRRLEAGKLNSPHFDLHFIPRLGPMDDSRAERVRYAMVISVHAPKSPDIYERVLAAFPELQALTPATVQAHV